MEEAALSRRGKMELSNQDFSQEIVNKYTKLGLFTLNFSPRIFTQRIVPFLGRWIELVYAMPYLISRREISTSLKESKTNVVTQPIEQIWNILVHFERYFMSSQYWKQPLSYFESRPPAEAEKNIYLLLKKFDTFKSQNTALLHLRSIPASERTPLTLSEQTSLTLQKSEVTDYTYKPLEREAQVVERKTPIYTKSAPWSLPQAVREQPKEERKAESIQKELPVSAHPLPIINYQPLTLSYKPSPISQPAEKATLLKTELKTKDLGTPFFNLPQKIKTDDKEKVIYGKPPLSSLDSISDQHKPSIPSAPGTLSRWGGVLPLKEEASPHSRLNILELGKGEPIYHTYPRIEPLTSRESHQIIREEKVIEKEVERLPQLPKIDVNRLADQVYQLMEKRIRIERERRGYK